MSVIGKILILVENLPVPFDRRVWMEANALTEAGYQVSVICPRGPKDSGHEVLNGISIYRYPPPPPTTGFLSYCYEFTYCWLHTLFLCFRVLRREGFDVIQACNPPDTLFLIGRIFGLLGKRFVFDHHDLCPECFEARFGKTGGPLMAGLRWLEKMTFRTARMVLCTNESYRQVALTRGGKHPEDVHVVRSGPDLSRFHAVDARPELRRGRRFLACYLGVMAPQDGVDYLIHAIDHVVKSRGRRDIAFTLIGGGDSLEELRRLVVELGLEEDIQFTGRVSDEELLAYLSTADAGLAPDPRNALNDVSSMNKIVEYMAMGLPIVSFDLKESRHSAQDAAVYARPNDEREFGDLIVGLMDDPDRRAQMSATGRQRMAEALCWEHSKRHLVAAYDGLFAHARHPAPQPSPACAAQPAIATASAGTPEPARVTGQSFAAEPARPAGARLA